ncbi:hypothetical protein P8605_31830 [Streptomyces sp. T-3]|nr:hypothetical protein [Streptomyces sp. T-3]
MAETWAFDDDTVPVAAGAAVDALRGRAAAGRQESWLSGSSGRLLGIVSNGDRALVMLLDGEDDPGAHAVTPGAQGSSGGYALANGQLDAYPDADTVPLADAFEIVRRILATGTPPAGAVWTVDR